VRSWRERLAVDIHANTPILSPTELTYAVQLFLCRIVFLRICEDREIEKYETLKDLDANHTFAALMEVLKRADSFYDSGLFRLLDDAPLGIRISDDTLRTIIAELYYPQSPYTLRLWRRKCSAHLRAVSGRSDHRFRRRRGSHTQTGSAGKWRSRATPRYIVDAIVNRTLVPAIADKSPAELIGLLLQISAVVRVYFCCPYMNSYSIIISLGTSLITR